MAATSCNLDKQLASVEAAVLPSLAELTDHAEVGLLVVRSDTGSKDGTPFQGGDEDDGNLGRNRQSLSPRGAERLD